RTITLLSAASYTSGTRIGIIDRSGNASPTTVINVLPSGSDTINGANSLYVAVIGPYTEAIVETDGISKWTVTTSLRNLLINGAGNTSPGVFSVGWSQTPVTANRVLLTLDDTANGGNGHMLNMVLG